MNLFMLHRQDKQPRLVTREKPIVIELKDEELEQVTGGGGHKGHGGFHRHRHRHHKHHRRGCW